MRKTIEHSRVLTLAATAVFLFIGALIPAAHAANIWDGGGTDGSWNTANNWDNNAVPASAQNLTFSGDVQTSTINNIASFTVGSGAAGTYSITFGNTGAIGTSSFNLAGNQITLASGSGAGGSIISSAVTVGSITDTISLNMNLGGNATISTGTAHNLIITGVMSQTSASRQLVKSGSGELILRNAGNSYLGWTSINAGTLTIDVANGIQNAGIVSALGAGTGANSQINFANGTLNVTLGAGSTDRQVRIGSNTGTTSTAGAGINNNSANGSNPLLFSNAAFNISAGAITVNRSLSLGGANTDANAISGVISDNNTVGGGTVSVTKSGVGRWILSGANTYTGATTISGGTLQLGDGTTGKDGTVASTSIVNNGSLVFNRFGSSSYGGVISGSGSVTKSGAGTQLLSGANNYSGSTTINAGTLTVAGSITSSSVVNGGLLNVNGAAGDVTVNNGGSLGGSGTAGAVTLTSGSFLKPGNSPGLLTAASSSWAAGSTYNWEIDQASGGTAGVNWDVFSVTGALDLSALSSTATMNLVLQSLPAMDDFSTTASYSWVFARAGSFIGTGLANGADVTNLFNIDATSFNSGNQPTNGFRVEVATDANNLRTLNLMAIPIPEPSTGSMLGFGLGGLVATRLLRRKQS